MPALLTFATASAAAFVTVSAGDPVLERNRTTISDEAREVIAQGGQVSCLNDGERFSRIVCLTAREWRGVADQAALIADEHRDRFIQGVARARFIQLGAVAD